jgi:hypothetical protein
LRHPLAKEPVCGGTFGGERDDQALRIYPVGKFNEEPDCRGGE